VTALDQAGRPALLAQRIESERDPRRRRNLAVVARHVAAEIDGDIDAVLATMVPEPTYHIWGASASVAPRGAAQVRTFYEDLVATGRNRLEFDISRVVVDDGHVVTDGVMRHAFPGTAVVERGLAGVEPVVPDDWYLVAYRLLIVWPVNDDGLLKGEDIFAGEVPRVLRRLAPGELPHLGLEGR